MDKHPSIIEFPKEVYRIWIDEKPDQLAAALAYFGMFSFTAVIYLAFRIAGIFINEAAAAERFYSRIEAILGPETASFIQSSVSAISAVDSGGSPIITIISSVSLLLAAIGLFLQLKYVLNRIWQVPLIQRGQRLGFIRRYWFAFLMVVALGLLIILGTVVGLALAWFGSVIKIFVNHTTMLAVVDILAVISVITLANAFVYKVLPDVKITWRDVWPGSVLAALLMGIGGLVIGIYFKYAGISSAFEAAGAFAVLMISIYYFAQIFLLGAVVTGVYTKTFGSMREPA
jgi:membrane protein